MNFDWAMMQLDGSKKAFRKAWADDYLINVEMAGGFYMSNGQSYEYWTNVTLYINVKDETHYSYCPSIVDQQATDWEVADLM